MADEYSQEQYPQIKERLDLIREAANLIAVSSNPNEVSDLALFIESLCRNSNTRIPTDNIPASLIKK